MINSGNIENQFNIHTDLAVENKERFEGQDVEISGVRVTEKYDSKHRINLTKVEILTDEGAKIMCKPKGKYITLEAEDVREAGWDPERMQEISKVLSRGLREMLPAGSREDVKNLSVLVVGLGNRDVTPDALGPYVISNLEVSRHIYMLKDRHKRSKGISAMIPIVMSSNICNTMILEIMWKVLTTVGISAVKSQLKDLHSWESAIPKQLLYRLCKESQILSNYILSANLLLNSIKQSDARSLFPVTAGCILIAVRNCVIRLKASEMVKS